MQLIPIDAIKTQSSYLRIETDVEKLKKSIQTIGLINPLTINENNELIAGGRRFKALKELGFTEVPVTIISDTTLKQELISIDENLVRQDLTKIEMERYLNRGREIYEELFPSAVKVEEEDVTKPEGQQINEELPAEKRSFLDVTAEKTGLSKKSIKQAIDRDLHSSEKVKQLRSLGELNASQTNELIKLDKEQQDKVVELVKTRPAKDIKQLVKTATQQGLEEAVDKVINSPSVPKEYASIHNLAKRMNKLSAKVILEEITCEHKEMEKILKSLEQLSTHIEQIMELHDQSAEPDHLAPTASGRYFQEETAELNLN